MPRPKGSKNKPKEMSKTTISTEKNIEIVTKEIQDLTQKLRDSKKKLKALQKLQIKEQKEAEKRKSEENNKQLLDAIAKSGKSMEELLEFLK